MSGFGPRLQAAVLDHGPVCVGIDPHAHLLDAWGLPDTADGAERFGHEVVAAAQSHVGVVKPQAAFFERFGSRGYAALERVIRAAREAGLIVLADVKRGDMGTSVTAYGEAWLRPGAPLEVDAITVSAFQGLGSLDGLLRLAEGSDKGAFVLCATSNPEARATQLRRDEHGVSVAAAIERDVADWNLSAGRAFGSIGIVVGATVNAADFGVSLAHPMPVLAPGFGHQGASLAQLRTLFPADALVLAAVSRSVLGDRAGLRDAIDRAIDETQR